MATLLVRFRQRNACGLAFGNLRGFAFNHFNAHAAVFRRAYQRNVRGVRELGVFGLVLQRVLGCAVHGKRELGGLLSCVRVAAVVARAGKHVAIDGTIARLREHGRRSVAVAAHTHVNLVAHKRRARGGHIGDIHRLRGGAYLAPRQAVHRDFRLSCGNGYRGHFGNRHVHAAVRFNGFAHCRGL